MTTITLATLQLQLRELCKSLGINDLPVCNTVEEIHHEIQLLYATADKIQLLHFAPISRNLFYYTKNSPYNTLSDYKDYGNIVHMSV